jgi:hypothetical protein
MPQGNPTALGGLTGGLQQGLQNAVALTQARQQKETFDIQKRQALFQESMKNMELVRDRSLPEEFRTKVWNYGVVPGFKKVFPDLNVQPYDKLPEGIDGGIKSFQAIFDKVSKGEMTPSAALHALGGVTLQTGQEAPKGITDLLTTGARQDFEMEKMKKQQEFDLAKQTAKAKLDAEGGEGGGGPTFTKIEGKILEQYLKGGLESLTPEQKTIIDNRLTDPVFSQVLNFYSQDVTNLGKKPAERLKGLQDTLESVRALQKSGLQITPGTPGGTLPPAPEAGTPQATAPKSFKTIDEAKKAYKNGQIKVGDQVVVGGQEGTWQ